MSGRWAVDGGLWEVVRNGSARQAAGRPRRRVGGEPTSSRPTADPTRRRQRMTCHYTQTSLPSPDRVPALGGGARFWPPESVRLDCLLPCSSRCSACQGSGRECPRITTSIVRFDLGTPLSTEMKWFPTRHEHKAFHPFGPREGSLSRGSHSGSKANHLGILKLVLAVMLGKEHLVDVDRH